MSDIKDLKAARVDRLNDKDLRDAYLRLSANKDFKKLILVEFLQNEPVRALEMSTEPGANEGQRADAISYGKSAGHLKRFFHKIDVIGNRAEADIAEIDMMLLEAAQADASDE